jgi:L-lactate dehydrogenase complex protein LldG
VSEARAEVLRRIRGALGHGAAVPEVPRDYLGAGDPAPSGGDVVELFCERCADYRATVRRVSAAELPTAVSAACAERGARRLVTPPEGPTDLEGLELVADDPPLGPRELDGFDGVLTGCALAIAETGTIVLDGGARSGRRAITLVPDYHVCVVEAERIVAAVPDAVAALAEAAAEGRPVTFVSGPSATSDIELDRVEGVHGPRTLDVFVVGGHA